jgi:hypothetical protein
MRAVFETLGMQDVVAKSLGSSNPYNMVRATFDALKHRTARARSRAARHQGLDAAGPREGADEPKPPRPDREGLSHGKAMAGKTVTVEQIGSPIRRRPTSARR